MRSKEKDFAVLDRFLDRFGTDVEGRSREEIPPRLHRKFKAFAAGKLSHRARSRLAGLLKEHPPWVGDLAEAVRSRTRRIRAEEGGSRG